MGSGVVVVEQKAAAFDPVQQTIHAWLEQRFSEAVAGADFADTLLLLALHMHVSTDMHMQELNGMLADALGYACAGVRSQRLKQVFMRPPLNVLSLRAVAVSVPLTHLLILPLTSPCRCTYVSHHNWTQSHTVAHCRYIRSRFS
jgi:hypothetical protein